MILKIKLGIIIDYSISFQGRLANCQVGILPIFRYKVLEANMEVVTGIFSMGQSQGGNVHAFLLDDGVSGLTLVDTLFDTDAHRVLAQVESIGKKIQDIKHIILTHAHRSHLGGLARLKELSGAEVFAHEWEADIISGNRRAQPVSYKPYRPYRVYPLQVGLNLDIARHVPAKIDQFIHQDDRIGPLQVIFAPGHSPGHLAFYWPEKRALITGDAVCTWPTFTLGWKGFTLNPKQFQESLLRLAELEADVLLVGHGEPVKAGGAARIRKALSQGS
jgi:glyoxylase-like metal-dependent hydrolase (beta-lactamase superfamily II)